MLLRAQTSTLFPYTTLFRSKLSVPALVSGRASRITPPLTVRVVVAGIDRRQVQTSELQTHVMEVSVPLIGEVPLSVPPCMVRLGMVSALALFRVRVPPDIRM